MSAPDNPMRMRENAILRVTSKALIPFMFLFGLYVQFHGDFGPGGGFQAGVIFAAGVVLYGIIFGLDAAQRLVPPSFVERGAAFGVVLYGGVGVVSLLMGGNYLDFNVLDSHDPAHGQHLGILLVEAGVGITVTCVMIAVFYFFAARAR